jgi:hypothetical protein
MKIRHYLTLILSSLLVACGGTFQIGVEGADEASAGLLGRWQRVSPAGPGDPNELSSEYIEFREAGVLLTLLRDADAFWLIGSATYSLTTDDQLQVVGTCYKGWERYACTRTYAFTLAGDSLTISGDGLAEYQRISALDPNLPPTLAPPFPSPTPNSVFPATPAAGPSPTPPPPPFTPSFPTPAPLHLIPVESDLTKPFSDIAVISFDGSYYNQLTTYGYNADPVFSPDGQFIAYRSVPASITTLPDPGSLLYSGQYNIWVITFDGAQAWKLTDSATTRSIPAWSPDSRRVIFSEGEAGALVEVEVATQTRRELLAAGGRDPRYRPDGNGIGYITAGGGLAWMDSIGNVRALVDEATLPPLTTVHDFDWLPDGTTAVYTLADERERIEGTTVGIKYSVWLLKLAESAPIKLADDVHDAQVSPDGQTIATQAGSGFGDACLVDLQTTFLLLAPDRTSASLVSVAGFSGLPAISPDGVFYPTSKVVWVSPHQAMGQFSLTCTAGTTAPGVYVIDVSARQLTQIRHNPFP